MDANQPEDDAIIGKKFSFMVQAISGGMPDGTLKSFESLKSDQDKFSLIWGLKAVHDVLDLESEYEKKSRDTAKKYRELGNDYFKKKSYLTALGEYNTAVLHAPPPGYAEPAAEKEVPVQASGETSDVIKNGKTDNNDEDKNSEVTQQEKSNESENKGESGELALVFGNRSAALFHLQRYSECLIDIQAALDFQYPADIQHKLYERRGKCLVEMDKIEEAIEAFQQAKHACSTCGLKDKLCKTLCDSFDKQIEICSQILDKKKNSDGKFTPKRAYVFDGGMRKVNIPELCGSENKQYPCASSQVEIKETSTSLGTHTVALNKLSPGDVLMIESPLVSVLFPQYYKSHCYHCFVSVAIPIPCSQCSSLVYCSTSCRDESWSLFHQHECSYLAILDQEMCGRIGHLALRVAVMIGYENMLDLAKNARQVTAETDSKKEEYTGSYSDIYNKLVHNSRSRKIEDSFNMTVLTCFIMKVLQMTRVISSENKSDDLNVMGGVILRFLHIIQCNAWPIIELEKPDKFDDPKPSELGMALYPTAAFINHSCDPNSDIIFYDDVLVLRAIRNIKPGEQITISYGPVFFETKLTPRLKMLKKTHAFTCRCDACEEAWPILQEMFEVPIYLCTECGQRLDSEQRIENKYFKCTKCEYKQNMEEMVGKLQDSFDTFAQGMNEALSGRSEDALPKFIQHQLLIQSYIRHPWRDLAACHASVRNCYRLQGNIK